ncbi:hypothetical protein [Desulfuromonas versatilis]|nr:hypothetical protein [Desulfuromonas versatilis]
MTNHGFLHPYRKSLLRFVLLAFVILASGGAYSADLGTSRGVEEICFQVKVTPDSSNLGVTKTIQVFHVTQVFSPQALCCLHLAATRPAPRSTLAALVPATPCRAPPAV